MKTPSRGQRGNPKPLLLSAVSHPHTNTHQCDSALHSSGLTYVEGGEGCIWVAQALVQAAHQDMHSSLTRNNALQHRRAHIASILQMRC